MTLVALCTLSLQSYFLTSQVPDLGHAECRRGISRPRKFHEITYFIIDTFAQCVKESTDALWISLRNSIKKHSKNGSFLYLRKT